LRAALRDDGRDPDESYHGTLVQLIGPPSRSWSVPRPSEPHAADFDLRSGPLIALGKLVLEVP
jgi:hypothetical protein